MKLKRSEVMSDEEKKMREAIKLVWESPFSEFWNGWAATDAKTARSYFRFSRGKQ